METKSLGVMLSTLCLIALMPQIVSAQSGILHKRVPSASIALPSSANISKPLQVHGKPDAIKAPVAANPSLPSTGDDLVHALPVNVPKIAKSKSLGSQQKTHGINARTLRTRIPQGLERAASTPAQSSKSLTKAFEVTQKNGQTPSLSRGPKQGIPQGLERAASTPAQSSKGLTKTFEVTQKNGQTPSPSRRPKQGIPSAVRSVGRTPSAQQPTWTERFRFSWPWKTK
jgi:hypothetical protein